jgi:hypothetical protein
LTKVVQVPGRIPAGFNLRVLANTLHSDNDKRQVTCAYGVAKIRLSFRLGETLERLSVAVVAEIVNRGQGNQWFIEGNPREEIDFDYEYPILPIPRPEEVTIFLKQVPTKVRINEKGKNLSDRLVQQLGLPRGTLFRIYPVDCDIQRPGNDDHAFSFAWKNGAQYWFVR